MSMKMSNNQYKPIELQTLVEIMRTKPYIVQEVKTKKQTLITRTNRAILTYLSLFCRVDVFRFYRYYCPQVVQEAERTLPQTPRSCRSRWPTLALIAYIYMASKMLANIYFQYIYDYSLYRVKIWQNLVDFTDNHAYSTEYLKAKQAVGSARQTLESIGAPFIEFNFITVAAYQYILYMSFINYINGQVWYNLSFPMDFRLGRLILYGQYECVYSLQLICREVNKFINSSKNYISNLNNISDSSLANNNLDNYKQQVDCLKQLKQLTFENRLRPLNCSPRWYDQLSNLFCLFAMSILFWLLSLLITTLIILQYLFRNKSNNWTWSSSLMALENVIMCLYVILPPTLYFLSVVLNCIDRTYYLNKLCFLIKQSSTRIQAHHVNIMVMKKHKMSIGCELEMRSINGHLLYCYLHYKIFIAQFKTLKKPLELAASHVYVIWFVMPIISLLHGPYVTMTMVKSLALYVCLGTCIVLNIMLISICHMYNRSSGLYKLLCSLQAQMIQTMQLVDHQIDASDHAEKLSYEPHLIQLLRKILDNPDMFMKQFAALSMGIHLSYSNLIKLYFWSSVILLTMMHGVGSRRDDPVFGRILNDPFALFDIQPGR